MIFHLGLKCEIIIIGRMVIISHNHHYLHDLSLQINKVQDIPEFVQTSYFQSIASNINTRVL